MTTLFTQFFSRYTLAILSATFLMHILAAFVLHNNVASLVVLGVVTMGSFVLTRHKPEYGLALALYELVIGVHGHLFFAEVFGFPVFLRLAVFVGVVGGWGVTTFLRRRDVVSVRWTPLLACAPLLVAVVYGVVRGVATGQGMGTLVDDANSYAFLLYALPLVMLPWTQANRRLFLVTLCTGALWVSLFTLALLFTFTHISQAHIWDLYVLVRDTRMFEVTLLSSPSWLAQLFVGGDWYFRVFSQAQIFVPISMVLFAPLLFFLLQKKDERVGSGMWVAVILGIAGFIASMSRSFVVGSIAALGILFTFLMIRIGRSAYDWKILIKRKMGMFASCVVAMMTLWALVSFPFPSRPDLTASPFYRGDHDDTRALAVSSRWNMLDPLLITIAEHPFLGFGFGKEITYTSDDPRVREMTGGTGELTTYRFEWGYLDGWVKMGVFGVVVWLVLYSAVAANIVLHVVRQKDKSTFFADHWLDIGLFSALTMLFAVHVFTPYLNHPIGIGFLLFALWMMDWQSFQKTKSEKVPSESSLNTVFSKTLRTVAVRVRNS